MTKNLQIALNFFKGLHERFKPYFRVQDSVYRTVPDAQTGYGSETMHLTQLTYAKLPLLASRELFCDCIRLVQEVNISEDGGHLILHVSLWHPLLNKMSLKEQLDLIKE